MQPIELILPMFLKTREMNDPEYVCMNQPSIQWHSLDDLHSFYSSDFSYSKSFHSADQTAPFRSSFSDSDPMAAGLDPQLSSYMDDSTPKKNHVQYEDLRLKNQENYEGTMTQRAETLLKPEIPVPQDAKKNKYRDTWNK